jgi:hypothetical protein
MIDPIRSATPPLSKEEIQTMFKQIHRWNFSPQLFADADLHRLRYMAEASLSETAPCKKGDCDEWHRLMREVTAKDDKAVCVVGNKRATDALAEAMRMVVRQNSNDMLLTGEELRRCEMALADYKPDARCATT